MDTSDDKMAHEVKASSTKAVTLRVNPWWLACLLAVVCIAMLLLWRPWQGHSDAGTRTVTVSGEATLKAEPDEYQFNPQYEFKNVDKAAGLAELRAKSDEVVTELKKVGVADKDIKTNANGYRDYYYYNQESKEHTYTLTVEAATRSRDMAQKVQDYLMTTEPSGQVTPYPTFSTATQKKLGSQGRDEATKDARAKAEQQASNLGFKLGKVKSVSDRSNGYGGMTPMLSMGANDAAVKSAVPSMAVQPGQNDLTYSVEVVYYIR